MTENPDATPFLSFYLELSSTTRRTESSTSSSLFLSNDVGRQQCFVSRYPKFRCHSVSVLLSTSHFWFEKLFACAATCNAHGSTIVKSYIGKKAGPRKFRRNCPLALLILHILSRSFRSERATPFFDLPLSL